MSYRYLLHFSYIGTHFRGLQSQKNDIKATVQGSIELGLKKLNLVHEPKLFSSSRTDTGVHALNSSAHVDLQVVYGKPYSESKLTTLLNKYFYRENLQIRVNKIEIVPDTFHARFSAKQRTYLYRLAIIKNEFDRRITPYVPIDEIDRCYFVHNPKFDTNLANEAVELIKGRHDFRSFMSVDNTTRQHHPFYALRDINSIKIEEGESTSNVLTKPLADEIYNYFNIQISGRSFLYRQVRRMVAVILGVAQDRLTIRDVYEMLTIPSKNTWPSKIAIAPPHGLYLCQVEYDNKDKEFPVSELSCTADHVNSTENELS